eukprot:109598-Chlamydomonas_euryale.AAC.2
MERHQHGRPCIRRDIDTAGHQHGKASTRPATLNIASAPTSQGMPCSYVCFSAKSPIRSHNACTGLLQS